MGVVVGLIVTKPPGFNDEVKSGGDYELHLNVINPTCGLKPQSGVGSTSASLAQRNSCWKSKQLVAV